LETIWIARGEGQGSVVHSIGDASIAPGAYTLEVTADGETQSSAVQVGGPRLSAPTISYNANLSAAERHRALGHQYLARGNSAEARVWLERSWREQPTDATQIEILRLSVLAGQYDSARIVLKGILERDPENFEALTTLAYIEAQLQDNEIAERLYTRALRIHDSLAVARALAGLRTK
jgi:Tfp pilus assembly protein PilF